MSKGTFVRIYALYFLFVIWFCCSSIKAEANNAEMRRVRYSLAIPKEIRWQVPPKGRSRFYGVSSLKIVGHPVFIHVYDVAWRDTQTQSWTYGVQDYAPSEIVRRIQADGYGFQQVRVDLYIRHKATRRYEKINSVSFYYQRDIYKEFVSVNILWLDPKTRRAPIISIDFLDPNPSGETGMQGTQMLVIFPEGLRARSIVEGFGYGRDSRDAWGSQFNETDAKGFLRVTSHIYNSDGNTVTTLGWNGNYFIPLSSKTTVTPH